MVRCSVAMCTYNGAKHLRQQLESIINQDSHVYEIIICDDGSKDETIAIIQDVAISSRIPIHLFVNDSNLGIIRNFAKAISFCKGDIILLSDQDDIWMKNKVSTIVEAFELNQDKDLISTNAQLIDKNNNLISNVSLWEITHLNLYNEISTIGFLPEFFAASGRITGATVAFRNIRPYNNFMQYCGNFDYHDEIITSLAVCNNRYLQIDKKLIKYRLTEYQNCGLNRHFLDRDIRVPYDYASNFLYLPLNVYWRKRIIFIVQRIAFKRRPWYIIQNWKKYNIYGKYAMRFRIVDFMRFVQGLLHKLKITKSGDWVGNNVFNCH